MNKYVAEWTDATSPEDVEAGRVYDVVHRQAWQDGAYLPPVCGRATKDDAERIADVLSRFEQAETLLHSACYALNNRGRLSIGGYDRNTEAGAIYRDILEFLNIKEI